MSKTDGLNDTLCRLRSNCSFLKLFDLGPRSLLTCPNGHATHVVEAAKLRPKLLVEWQIV